jgi:hypothetical protein
MRCDCAVWTWGAPIVGERRGKAAESQDGLMRRGGSMSICQKMDSELKEENRRPFGTTMGSQILAGRRCLPWGGRANEILRYEEARGLSPRMMLLCCSGF